MVVSVASRGALLDVNAFLELCPSERTTLAHSLAAELGPDWLAVERATDGVPVLRYEPAGADFVIVPGGKFSMGLSDADIATVAAQGVWDEDWEASLRIEGETAVPCVEVVLRPFLLQLSLADAAWMTREAALDAAASAGCRLPSEAELEWVIRNGGQEALHLGATPDGKPGGFVFKPSVFGLRDLLGAHWAADDWFPSHAGASANGAARVGGDASGVCRITFPLDAFCCSEDVTSLFAALRYRGSPAMPAAARFARDLPSRSAAIIGSAGQ